MSTLFYRNRYLLVLVLSILLLAGISAFFKLPRLEDPRITNRNPIIITKMPGASATRVESLVTEKIEDALQEIFEIKKIESVSRTGGSVIAIELEDWVGPNDNQAIFSKIRDKLTEVEPELPPEASPPLFDDRRVAIAYTMIVGILWNDDSPPQYNILNRLAEELSDRLRNISGTELVRTFAQPKEEISVIVDQDESTLMGVNSATISQVINSADVKIPAGIMRGSKIDLLIEVEGELTDTYRIGSIPITTNDQGLVSRVSDIASIDKNWKTPLEEIAIIDGKEGILVSARMGEGIKIDEWIAEADAIVDEFTANRGPGIDIVKVFDQSIYTNDRLGELGGNLVAGAFVVTLIVFLTMGWRSALIVGSALPLTAGVSLFALQISGGALHQMAIYGMIIALGLLIDNAIVVVDEVRKRLREGMKPLEALESTYNHLFVPLLSSTFTTVLGFTPIFLLPGNVGDFVRAIGGSVISAIAASFFISMTLISSLAAIFISAGKSNDVCHWWERGYYNAYWDKASRKHLKNLFTKPMRAIAISLFFPLLGFAIGPSLGSEFFPPTDRDMFDIKLWMPPETSINKTREIVEQANEYLKEYPEIKQVDWMIGNNFPIVYYNQLMIMDFTPNYAQASVKTQSSDDTMQLVHSVQEKFDKDLALAQTVVKKFAQGPPKQADIEYRIFGPSLSTMQDVGDDIRLMLQNHRSILQTQMTLLRGNPKLWFNANEIEAKRAGFTLTDLTTQLQSNLEGLTAGSVIENLDELKVRVRYGDNIRNNLSQIESINFISPTTQAWTPLTTLGNVVLKPEIGAITRYNSERCNIVRGFTTDGSLPIDVTHEVLNTFNKDEKNLPEGYRIELGGDVELDAEAIENLKEYAPILIILMLTTLILSFQSVRLAMILITVSIMSVGLGLLSTWMISFPISFNTILGTLGLIGVAINDSIVVMAAIHANPKSRKGDIPAIVDEVMGAMRHVISTTLTTMGGFLPILLFIGGEFWPSLAIVMVGGVAGATLMAVLFIPAMYLLTLSKKEAGT
jgi:multidrug efflux pump subunit AcrB